MSTSYGGDPVLSSMCDSVVSDEFLWQHANFDSQQTLESAGNHMANDMPHLSSFQKQSSLIELYHGQWDYSQCMQGPKRQTRDPVFVKWCE